MITHPESQIIVDPLDSLTVSCAATGVPIDNFIFTRDGQVLTDNSNTNITIIEETAGGLTLITAILKLCSVTFDDEGEYSCIAGNAMDNDSATFSVELTRESAP